VGVFIRIEVAEEQLPPDIARQLVSLCPVDIFALRGERFVVRPEQEDECTLCELCLDAAPVGVVSIQKLYADERLVSRRDGRPQTSNPSANG
jgi:NAD-dependent dihydropyrimidine dehydrogenase PreA subunit